ncbi:MAG: hypothetical protein DWP95_05495 [Proteobacteria bacterium]|nr:MAG: hypothetical protein DWP95_05495 [Pseudomonadota bacterium]
MFLCNLDLRYSGFNLSSIKTEKNNPLIGIKDDLPFALMAFVIWGGWTFYANAQAGYWTALVSACAQGVFSMLMTFLWVI